MGSVRRDLSGKSEVLLSLVTPPNLFTTMIRYRCDSKSRIGHFPSFKAFSFFFFLEFHDFFSKILMLLELFVTHVETTEVFVSFLVFFSLFLKTGKKFEPIKVFIWEEEDQFGFWVVDYGRAYYDVILPQYCGSILAYIWTQLSKSCFSPRLAHLMFRCITTIMFRTNENVIPILFYTPTDIYCIFNVASHTHFKNLAHSRRKRMLSQCYLNKCQTWPFIDLDISSFFILSYFLLYLSKFSNFNFSCHRIAAMARTLSLFSNCHYKFPVFFFLFFFFVYFCN